MPKITITAKVPQPAQPHELPICTPVLMRNPDGNIVVVVRGLEEAICFDTDNTICYSNHDYYKSENGYTFIREMTAADGLTVKGATA